MAKTSANVGTKATKEITTKKETTKATQTTKRTTTKSSTTKASSNTVKTQKPVATKEELTKVLFITTEATPFATTGDMGEVCSALPRALNAEKKADARVMLPLYAEIADKYKADMTFVCNVTVNLAWRNQYCGLFMLEHDGVTYYFVDNEYYFKRANLYGDYDDAERFAFLSKAALELIPHLGFKPDVLQSNDHLTALVPIYYAMDYKNREGYENIKNVFTIHNINYQGTYPLIIAGDVFGISEENLGIVEYNGKLNLMKGAIVTCDMITTMSPQYAKEIRLPEYSGGLDGILIENRNKICGILNGIDVNKYDPKTSTSLFRNYDVDTLDKKAKNKLELQRMLNLPEDENIPLVCMVARMAAHKGYDLLRKSINNVGPNGNLLDTNIQLVILGQGDADIEGYLMHIQKMYDRRVRAIIAYNPDLVHKILAAADVCLVPSRTEPCGLTHMAACRFGTVPVVRATGGLIDAIRDCDKFDDGNGFVFEEYDSDVLDTTITRAVSKLYYHKDEWRELQKRCMACDFSWKNAAGKYSDLYKSLKAE